MTHNMDWMCLSDNGGLLPELQFFFESRETMRFKPIGFRVLQLIFRHRHTHTDVVHFIQGSKTSEHMQPPKTNIALFFLKGKSTINGRFSTVL